MTLKKIKVPYASLKNLRNKATSIETQCLFGETLEVLETKKNWSFCKCLLDNYKGWIENKYLDFLPDETHLVSNTCSLVFEKPNIKSTLLCNLYLNSKVSVKNEAYEWFEIFLNNDKTGFIPKSHLISKSQKLKDWIETSIAFKNSPYLWGGKSILGIDCSALVQISLEASGLIIPRNTHEQLLFKSNKLKNTKSIKKGCLIFWKGHVAIAISKNEIIHSNAFHMSVKIEKLNEANKRINKTEGNIIGIRQIHL